MSDDSESCGWSEPIDERIVCPLSQREFGNFEEFSRESPLGPALLGTYYDKVRLVNWCRINKRLPQKDELDEIKDGKWLVPVLEGDALLQALDFDSESIVDPLEQLRSEFEAYKLMVKDTFMSDALKDNLEAVRAESVGLDYYFSSYCEPEIHATMLKDAVRTNAYRDFVYDNKHLFNGKVVLDVGCGTGILSMFCARMGARVYAVDNATVIEKAKLIAKENGLDAQITFIVGQVEDVELPEKVDIVVSEWMGYFLLFEGMLHSVIAARDVWLKPDGIMAPSTASILLACYSDEEWYNDNYHFWNDIYGFKMSAMKHRFIEDAQIDYCRSDSLASTAAVLKVLPLTQRIDTRTTTAADLDFETDFELRVEKDIVIHGFCGWFDIGFEAPDSKPIYFSTSCTGTQTHWKQTVFVLEKSLDAHKGDIVSGRFVCKQSPDNHRELVVFIEYKFNGMSGTQKYLVR